MLLSNNSILEELKSALDFFFRRRPTLESIMWHTENVRAGQRFTVPTGKIYEIYMNQQSGLGIWFLNGVLFAVEGGLVANCWLPLNYAALSVIGWTHTDEGAAPHVRYDADAYDYMYSANPHGLILSEGEYITEGNNFPFQVRWRDVTHRQ